MKMGKRILTLVLVVAAGVFAGVSIVGRQAEAPLLRELLNRQNTLLEKQNKMERVVVAAIKELGEEDYEYGRRGDGRRLGTLSDKQEMLENRLTALESQLKSLTATLKQVKGNLGNVPQAPPQEDLSKVYTIPVAHSPVNGKKNAPVTIVEFSDFQCPFCARFHPPVVEVLEAYPKEVNFVLKNFPLSFHPQAKPAAKAAFAAGEQGKYWEMVDALLENGRALSEAKYEELAKDLGLNVKKFMKDYKEKDAQWEDYIQKDMALARQVDVRGTPTFFINGKKTNARDFSSFKREIDQILSNKK